MKAVLVIDMPHMCNECPMCSADTGFLGDITRSECRIANRDNLVYLDGMEVPEWCPLIHSLKYVSKDFYIYDTKYLMENLDREYELLKGVKQYESHISN